MAKWDVDLKDGRTVEVEADTLNEAVRRQGILNDLIDQRGADIYAANQPESVNPLEAFVLSAGRETDKLVTGAKDLYYAATGNDDARQQIAEDQAYKDQAFAPVQKDNPWSTMVGGVLPYFVAPTAGLLPAVAMGAGAAATRYGTPEEKMTNAAMDAVLSALPFGMGRAARSFGIGDGGPMVDRALNAGYRLTPGERFGSRSLRTLEGGIQSMPMIGNPMHRIARQNQDLLNRTAGEAIGVPRTTSLTDDVIGSRADELGEQFRALEGTSDLKADDEFLGRLADIQDTSVNRLFSDPDLAGTVDKVFDRLDDTGRMKAADYQDMSSELKAKIRTAWQGRSPDAKFAQSLSEIVDALDELAEGNMTGEALSQLREARKQWRSLAALENSRALRESGDVSGPLLANYLRRTDKGGYLRGGNKTPLYELARATKAFPGMPDSGTAGRSFLQQFSSNPALGAVGALSSPFISTAANAYMYGLPAAADALRFAQRYAPTMVSPEMAGRLAAGAVNPEEEEVPPYLARR